MLDVLALALALALQSSPTGGGAAKLPWGWNQVLVTSGQPAPIGQFGRSLDLDGQRLVVGASHEPDGLPYVGSATVFRREGGTWLEEVRLCHPNPSAGAVFGTSVALDAERVAVGAPFDDIAGHNAGAVHVFVRDDGGWRLEATLTGADTAADDHFGIDVALAGDTLLVGAHGHDAAGLDAGAAYLFRRDAGGWRQHSRLTPAPGTDGARFGDAVDLDTQRAVVAAPWEFGAGPDAGAVYVHRVADGGLEARLGVEGSSGLYFGASVAVAGTRLAVGATGSSLAGPYAGAVHLFEFEGARWKPTAVVLGHDSEALDRFGTSVGLSAGRLAVGAHRNNAWAPQAGAAYLFSVGQGPVSELAVLRPAMLEQADLFGYSLAFAGDQLAVGAPLADQPTFDAGATFVFTLP